MVLLQGVLDDGADGRVLLAELGRHLGVVWVLHHAQQVVVNQHLPHSHIPLVFLTREEKLA